MTEAIDAVLLGLVYVVPLALLALEWRYRLRSLRLLSAGLAVAMLVWFQPNYYAAWRRAMSTPPSERETHYPHWSADSVGRPLSEFESGVFAMHRAVIEVAAGYDRERWLAVGVLFWLACTPALRRDHRLSPGQIPRPPIREKMG